MHLIAPYDGAPDKQRLIAAMRGEPTDRVPNFEVLIEDRHVERLLGRMAGSTLGVGGDPAKGSEAAEGVRPMYPDDYLQLCRIIGQDAIVLENLWTPIRQRKPDGTAVTWSDRTLKGPADLERIVWPGEDELQRRVAYIGEYVEAARGTGVGVMFLCGCIFQTLYEFVIGLNDCMVLMVEEPDLFDELMARSADYFAQLVRRAVAEGVDYRDYKRRYGHRVSLSGNIDITWPLVKGTPDDVERDVKEHMDVLKPGGRWIAGSSHSIVNYVPHENFAAMINAIHKYGKY